jgi:hypothetical protein
MKVIEDSGNYLEKNLRKSQIIFTINLAIFLSLYISSIKLLPFYLNLGGYNDSRVALYFASAIIAFFYYRRYRGYRKGIEGEKTVTKYLKSFESLNAYTMLNNFTPDDDNVSNIDHVVLGSNGIFVIETKNYSTNKISFDRDAMTLVNKGKEIRAKSPCGRTRWNAIRIQETLKSSKKSINSRSPWVQGVLVFTQNDVKLEVSNLNNPIVVKLDELPNLLLTFSRGQRLSPEELKNFEEVLVEANVSRYFSLSERLFEILTELWNPELKRY